MKKRMDMQRETNYYIHYIVKGWTLHGVSDLASTRGHERTRTNWGSRMIYIIEKHARLHRLIMSRARLFGLLVEASLFRLTGEAL